MLIPVYSSERALLGYADWRRVARVDACVIWGGADKRVPVRAYLNSSELPAELHSELLGGKARVLSTSPVYREWLPDACRKIWMLKRVRPDGSFARWQ